MSDLPINDFILEAYEILERTEVHLIELEKKANRDSIDLLFRDFHNLKGSSALFNFNVMSELGHHLENALETYRDDDQLILSSDGIDIILESLDVMKKLLSHIEKEKTDLNMESEIQPIIAKINKTFST